MKHTPQEIAVKAAQILRCLAEATVALTDPEVLEQVAKFALDHPEISWEPVAIVAEALNVKRCLDEERGKPAAPPLPEPTILSLPSSGTLSAGAVYLPPPPMIVF